MSDPSPNPESVFAQMIEIDSPEKRSAFLDQACGHDPNLRREMEKLVGDHFRAGQFLESPAAPCLATIEQPSAECPGTLIGPYKLMEQIGEGGMGLVFVAEQRQPVRRKVALKIIKPGMDSRQFVARFEAERQALAMMDHPNIAKVHDGGTTPTGRPYFVMELVRGVPITQYCDDNRLKTRERLDLFSHVCAAVKHAHQKGIIHRDIKPSNVLVVSHDGTPVVKVIDFGVAKAMGQQLTEKTVYTDFLQFIGTPLYMSPEQAWQSGLDVDTRTDVYALGVLLYELLTGTTPFDKDRLHKAGYDEIRRVIREEEPPKPSTRISELSRSRLPSGTSAAPEKIALNGFASGPARQAGPTVAQNSTMAATISAQRQSDSKQLCKMLRGELDWIVMKALEKDRNRRYESASALAADVQRYLQDEQVEACPPSALYRLRKFAWRHRTRLAFAAILGFAVLLGGVAFIWRQAERSATARAVDDDLNEAVPLLRDRHWAKALPALERAKARLDGSGGSSLEARVAELQRDLALISRLEEVQLKAAEISSDGKRDYAEAERAYVAAFAGHGLDVAAIPAEEIARQIKASAIRTHLVTALDYWALLKEALTGDGEPLRAIARLADDDDWRQKLRDPLVTKDGEALNRLAEEKGVLDQPPANLLILGSLLAKAKATPATVRLLRRAQERYPADFWINFELGTHLAQEPATAAESIGCYRAALALRPQNPLVYTAFGFALVQHDKPAEAIAACNTAIGLKRNAWTYNILGLALSKQHKLPEAVAAHHKAIELLPGYASAYSNLGIALAKQNNYAEAETAFRQAVSLVHSWDFFLNYGICLEQQGKLAEAEAAFRKSIQLDPKGGGRTYSNLGHTLLNQKKFPEAEAAFRKLSELRPSAEAFSNLGTVLTSQGKCLEGLAQCRKAIELDPNYPNGYYNAASAAVLCATGHGDAAVLDPEERARLRPQALAWLRILLVAGQVEIDKTPGRLAEDLIGWQKDHDFTRVREAESLAKLPEGERREWRKLSEEVEELRKRAAAPQPR